MCCSQNTNREFSFASWHGNVLALFRILAMSVCLPHRKDISLQGGFCSDDGEPVWHNAPLCTSAAQILGMYCFTFVAFPQSSTLIILINERQTNGRKIKPSPAFEPGTGLLWGQMFPTIQTSLWSLLEGQRFAVINGCGEQNGSILSWVWIVSCSKNVDENIL